MTGLTRWRGTLALGAALLLTACGGEAAEGGVELEAGDSVGAMDGLTPEQIRRQAEPMSPAVAESLGIVDTTIHIEDPFPGDSAVVGGSPPPIRVP